LTPLMKAAMTAIAEPRESLERENITALLLGASLELASRDLAEIDACVPLLEPGTALYINMTPGQTYKSSVQLAARARHAGFRPVPHIAAHQLASAAALEDFLARLSGEAGVDSALLIAGDWERPCGPFDSTAALLETGLFQRYGIVNIGVAGHPEGHPRVAADVLDAALVQKKLIAQRDGLAMWVVTQFCFEADPILAWAAHLKSLGSGPGMGLGLPVRVGVAGPASLTRLLRFAAQCGVGSSVRALRARPGAMTRLMTEAGPEALLRELAQKAAPPIEGVHFYCFGGLVHTARWLRAMLEGRFELSANGDFHVGLP
jgi:methylenetetrahydrofolate reductase (NADPH)